MTARSHWDELYATTPVDQTGWHEPEPVVSLSLIEKCNLQRDDLIVDVGARASSLVDQLIDLGFRRLVAMDVSSVALQKSQERLGREEAALVEWIVEDITVARRLRELRDVGLWHDRALLHFLTGEEERDIYSSTLHEAVRPGGFVILAAFAIGGAQECSGLPIRNYDAERLTEIVGAGFGLVETLDFVYRQPFGDVRPYVYALFQREQLPSL